MLVVFKTIFETLRKIDKFLCEDQIKNHNGFTLIVYSIIAIGAIGAIVQRSLGSEAIIKFTAFLFGIFIYITIPYLFFKSSGLKKYIIFGTKKTYQEIFNEFTFKSYGVFLVFFSFFSLYPILGVPILLNIYEIDIAILLIKDHLDTILYINAAIASVFWFAYYLVESEIPLQKIRTRVALFTASGTTIIRILNSRENEKFLIIMSYLLLSYLWVQYLLELKSCEKIIEQRADEDI